MASDEYFDGRGRDCASAEAVMVLSSVVSNAASHCCRCSTPLLSLAHFSLPAVSSITGTKSFGSSFVAATGRTLNGLSGTGFGRSGPQRLRSSSDFTRVGEGAVENLTSAGNAQSSRPLFLYSKPGCCLCDGLKEKLLSREGTDGIFDDIQIEVRDITTNEKWWNSYQFEIPVLTRLKEDGTEEPLPRLSPRLTAEQVQRKILSFMT